MKLARGVLVAALTALLSAAASPAGTGAGGLTLTAVKSEFPERSYVLTLPHGMALGARTVTVLENDKPVKDTAVTPTSGAGGAKFGTVLLLDTSNSMAGKPLQDAYAAARAFAGKRNPNQRLGVITFNPRVVVRLPLTTSSRDIDAALARPPETAEGTHLYDALMNAFTLLDRSGVTAGSVVLISDGADVGSSASADTALAEARKLHIRVFTVGLSSPQFTPSVLQRFASTTGAAYAHASSSRDLTRIYNQLGYRLAGEYLLQYKSFADPSEAVSVRVTVAGVPGVATASYVAPPLPTVPPEAVHKSIVDRILQSGYTMLVIAALAAVLVGFAVAASIRPKDGTLRLRLGAFVSVTDPDEEPEGAAPAPEGRPSFWQRLQQDIEIAQIRLTAGQIALLTVLGTIVAVWLLAAVLSPVFAVFGLLVPFVIRMSIRRQAERQKRLFGDQLPDNLQILSSALRSGHSLIGALATVVEDAPEPSRREFRRVVADEQVGIPLDDALRRVAERMSNRDLEQVALVAALQRETGGNSAEVLDRVAETVRERAALRRLVRTLTAQGRMARWIVSALPILLLVLISLINGKYMKPMFDRTLGQVMVAFAAMMVIAGSLAIRKIIDIKV